RILCERSRARRRVIGSDIILSVFLVIPLNYAHRIRAIIADSCFASTAGSSPCPGRYYSQRPWFRRKRCPWRARIWRVQRRLLTTGLRVLQAAERALMTGRLSEASYLPACLLRERPLPALARYRYRESPLPPVLTAIPCNSPIARTKS